MGSRAFIKAAPEKILVTHSDLNRLFSIFDSVNEKLLVFVDELDEKLSWADVIEPHEAPDDLVTMNSRILCRLPEDTAHDTEPTCLTLVYPQDADIVSNRISVLSQVGAALLGRRVGEIVSWTGNDGFQRKMKLDKLEYQPESSEDWHL